MGAHEINAIHNIALVGHAAAGKTTLGEAILLKAGVTNRLGSVDDGSSMLDYDEEAKERQQTIDSSLFYVEHNGHLLNMIDTPGVPDYCGQAIAALSGVETAAIVVSAAAGIGVNTRRMFGIAKDYGLARMIVITRLDAENIDLAEILNGVRETFGGECHPINLPSQGGKAVIDVLNNEGGEADVLDVGECHTALVDAIVETDDALMEQYMESGALPPEKFGPAIGKAVASGHVVPVLFVNSKTGVGVAELLDAFVKYAPNPLVGKKRTLKTGKGDDAKETVIEPSQSGDFIAQAFKITSDPKSNIKYAVMRVHSGTLKGDAQLYATGDRKGQRPGHPMKLRGQDHQEIEVASAGDLVAFAKVGPVLAVIARRVQVDRGRQDLLVVTGALGERGSRL